MRTDSGWMLCLSATRPPLVWALRGLSLDGVSVLRVLQREHASSTGW